jgi:transposase
MRQRAFARRADPRADPLARVLAVRLVNAGRVREFAESGRMLAKNDRIDAGVIAHFAETFPGQPVKPDGGRADLSAWVGARDATVEARTRCG